MYCCTSEGPLLSKCSSVLSGMFSPFSCTTRLAPGSSWPPCAAPAAEGHLKVQRVCQRTRVSDREGAMRGSGTEQEAVRRMGNGGWGGNKRKAQNTMLRKERWTLCLLPLFSDAYARVCVCIGVHIFFHNFSFSRTVGTFEKKTPREICTQPQLPALLPLFTPSAAFCTQLNWGEANQDGSEKRGKSPARNLKCI